MDKAKMNIVMATLKANGGKCTFTVLFDEAEKNHCDVLSAAIKSMKKVCHAASTQHCVCRTPPDCLPLLSRTRSSRSRA
eukprot:5303101-Prymnesium_polylepis.1